MKDFIEFLDKEGITEIDFEDRKVYEFMIDVVKRYEDEKVKLILNGVSQQRELLISFLEYLRVRDIANTKKDNIEVRVDLFIERNL